MSALSGDKENAINGKQKDRVQREMLAVSATMKISVEKQHSRSSPAPLLQTQNDGKGSLKGYSLSEVVVLLERDPEDRAEFTSLEIVRICHVISGILPNVNFTKTQLG